MHWIVKHHPIVWYLDYVIELFTWQSLRGERKNMTSPGFWSFPSKVVCLFLIESFSWKPWHQKRKRPHPLESCLPVSKTKHCCCCLAFFSFSPKLSKIFPRSQIPGNCVASLCRKFSSLRFSEAFPFTLFSPPTFFVAKKNSEFFSKLSRAIKISVVPVSL